MSYTWFTHDWVIFYPDELLASVRGQIGVEFCQESRGLGPGQVSYTCHKRDLRMTELLLTPLSNRQVWGVKCQDILSTKDLWSQTHNMWPTQVIHMIYMWLTYFLSRWTTGNCEGLNWERILPGIQWAWTQTSDTCPTCVITVIYMWLSYFWLLWATDKCEGSNAKTYCQLKT